MTETFCSLASLQVGEGLFGSAASDTDVWLVLEYTGRWEPQPLPGSDLPSEVRARIEHWLERIPGSRLQFIRRPGRGDDPPYALYVACSREQEPWMLRFDLGRYEDLLELDLDSIVRNGSAEAAEPVAGPMHLVCTHGKRDRCCAKWGQPLYQAFADRDPEGTWQTTHLGGHRFAANVVLLPHGVSYGRLETDDAPRMLETHRRGEMYDLDRLRGCTCHSAATQAAEYYVRRDTGFRALAGLRHRDTEQQSEGRWRVQFAMPDGTLHEVRVVQEATGERPKSCGDEPVTASRFRRLDR